MRLTTENLAKTTLEISKAIQDKGSDKLPSSRILAFDVERLATKRQMMMDFLYQEIEEHSRKLEVYSNLYQMTHEGIKLDVEFEQAMQEINKFSSTETNQFIQDKAKMAAMLKANPKVNSARSAGSQGTK